MLPTVHEPFLGLFYDPSICILDIIKSPFVDNEKKVNSCVLFESN